MTAAVRIARLDDIPSIARIGIEATKEGVWGDLDAVEADIYALLLEQARAGLVYVATVDDVVVGALVLRIQNWPWNLKARYLQGLLLFIQQPYRRLRDQNGRLLASSLINCIKALSDHTGYRAILDVMWGDQDVVEKRDEYVRRQGLDYIGGSFSYTPRRIAVAAE